MAHDDTFSLDEAVSAQRALRAALGEGEERFDMADFIGMVSDEIEALRDAGHDDDAIAGIIREAIGRRDVTGADVTEHYASPEERGFGDDEEEGDEEDEDEDEEAEVEVLRTEAGQDAGMGDTDDEPDADRPGRGETGGAGRPGRNGDRGGRAH